MHSGDWREAHTVKASSWTVNLAPTIERPINASRLSVFHKETLQDCAALMQQGVAINTAGPVDEE